MDILSAVHATSMGGKYETQQDYYTHVDAMWQIKNPTVTFTLMTSTKAELSKRYWLDDNLNICKKPAAEMIAGKAERRTIPFAEFQTVLNNATPKQAAVYGTHALDYSDTVKIALLGKENPHSEILARTKKYFGYPNGCGILMIDHDPNKYGKALIPDELLTLFCSIHPEIKTAARIIRGSVSAGVHREGEQPQAGKGFHIYLPVSNASDIPRYGATLFDRLWLAGHGYIALAKNGANLIRSPIDGAVFSPERLGFIAPPIISGSGLKYTPPEIVYHDGGHLDTSTLPDLDDNELKQLSELQSQAKQAINTQALIILDEWKAEKITTLTANGVTEVQAAATVEKLSKQIFRIYTVITR